MKTALVLQKWLNSGEIPPAKFYVRNVYGDYIFLHATCLKEARAWAEKHYPQSEVKSSKLAHKLTTRT